MKIKLLILLIGILPLLTVAQIKNPEFLNSNSRLEIFTKSDQDIASDKLIQQQLKQLQKLRSASNPNFQLDSMYSYLFSPGQIYLAEVNTYTYDPANHIEYKQNNILNGAVFSPNTLYIETKNTNDQLINLVEQHWDGFAWANSSQTIYQYNSNADIQEVKNQSWNAAWIDITLQTFTYDIINNTSTREIKFWDGTNWINTSTIIIAYAGNTDHILTLTFQQWNGAGMIYENTTRISYSYDVNFNELESINESWIAGAWQYTSKSTGTYDSNNNVINQTYYQWDGSSWTNQTITSYIYDSNNNMLEYITQIWNGTTWQNNSRWTYTYDIDNNLHDVLIEEWDGTNWALRTTYFCKYEYFWSPKITSVNTIENADELTLYPNPASTEIKLPASYKELTIYNNIGEKVMNVNTGNSLLNIESLEPGIYFLRMTDTDNKIRTAKFIRK